MFFLHDHRGIITLQGPDRKGFLQGLVTNDIHAGSCLYTAHLNPQGKFQQDFFIVEQGDTLFITPEVSRLENFLQKLQMFKLRSSVVLKDESADWALVSSFAPVSPDSSWFPDPRHPAMGYINIVPRNALPPLSPWPVYDDHRLTLGIPLGEADIKADRGIILECNFDELHGISWNKGCYMGQELMSRTKYTGEIRKRLLPVIMTGTSLALDTTIFYQGEKAGEMRTSQQNKGLALLRLEYVHDSLQKGVPFTDGIDTTLMPVIPSWLSGF